MTASEQRRSDAVVAPLPDRGVLAESQIALRRKKERELSAREFCGAAVEALRDCGYEAVLVPCELHGWVVRLTQPFAPARPVTIWCTYDGKWNYRWLAGARLCSVDAVDALPTLVRHYVGAPAPLPHRARSETSPFTRKESGR